MVRRRRRQRTGAVTVAAMVGSVGCRSLPYQVFESRLRREEEAARSEGERQAASDSSAA